MKIKCHYYNNFKINYIITEKTIDLFMTKYLEADDSYWTTTVLKQLENLYICILPCKTKNNKLLRISDFDIEEDIPIIIGYMIVHKQYNKEFRFIELLDTCFKGYNISFLMFEYYHKQFKNKKLLPSHIVKGSVHFWKKYFKIYYNLETKKDFLEFIDKYKFYDNIKWNYEASWDNLINILD
jgi:hypothetical protein